MKKIGLFVLTLVILTSMASAEIIITEQPQAIYNLGETIDIPVTIKPLTDISSIFEMNLICNGNQINFYKNGVALSTGQEKKIESSLILTKTMIQNLKGNCVIKAILNSEYTTTNEFTISDYIGINAEIEKTQISPEEKIEIKGDAEKESQKKVNGFLQIDIYPKDSSTNNTPTISKLETINNGFFKINITTSKSLASGEYKIILKAYEKDATAEIINQGTKQISFSVKQIPENLEIIIENPEVEPGTPLKAKTILHDQTGNNIESTTTIRIKNQKDKLIDKFEIQTGENFEFQTKYNDEPMEYKIIAKNSDVESEKNFQIKEKQDIKIQIINKTLTIKNTGNIEYCNKTVLVKIGEQSLNINPCLDVDEEEKYTLSAPDGDYEIQIFAEEIEHTENVLLTGKSIDIKKASSGVVTLTRYPLVWIFVIAILGFVAFNIYRKGFKRSFVGYIHRKKKSPTETKEIKKPIVKEIFSSNKAELCLSIKGEKQNSTIIGLKIKNHKDLKNNPEGVRETIRKISNLIQENKTYIYENLENMFIIFSPTKTKTFKNEKPALQLAQKIKEILDHHNKLFKQKIEFGISIETGAIIVKPAGEKIEFMGMGDFMTQIKKISSLSKETILLGEQIKEKLGANIKVEKRTKDKLNVYILREIKNKEENEKFIRKFLDGLEKKD